MIKKILIILAILAVLVIGGIITFFATGGADKVKAAAYEAAITAMVEANKEDFGKNITPDLRLDKMEAGKEPKTIVITRTILNFENDSLDPNDSQKWKTHSFLKSKTIKVYNLFST